jgi:HD-GYP domain-containing protein (c-di-GMP phosphodiesterase class II)
MQGSCRLAELLGGLSLAADRAAGQASECAIGATIMAVRMARAMDLSESQVNETYYACITRFIGCTSTAMDVAPMVLGDDLTLNYALNLSDPADPISVRAELAGHFAPDADGSQRDAVIDQLIEILPQLPHAAIPHCEQAIALSKRLPIPDAVPSLLSHLESRWDGKNPTKLGGSDVPQEARIIEFVIIAELYRRAGGLAAIRELAKTRSGGQFDPGVCAAFEDQASSVLVGFDAVSLWDLFLEAEPSTPTTVDAAQLQTVAEVFADFTDNKSGWFVGHSRQVAGLAMRAAEAMKLDEAERQAIFIAGLLHDVGRSAVPNGIWDHRGELSARERRIAQSHSVHTEEILVCSPVFEPILDIACAAHERCDGSGYHRKSRPNDPGACVIAAADVYSALVDERPWRVAHSDADAAAMLLEHANDGRLSRDAVRAVLQAAGHKKRVAEQAYPDGLTHREAEVLRELARGLTTKEIAGRLGMAAKTADNHIQNLYQKIGAQSRTAAAMYALERGIFTP